MISEKLAGLYNKAEDKYFDLLDFLDSKGLPVYTYSDFFENKGIPSFVVTISIILIMLIVLGIVLTYQGPDVGQLTLSLKDSDGKAITGVSIVVKDKQEIELYKGTANDGQKINLSRALYNSDKIYITAQKKGYQNVSIEFTIGESNNSPRIRFSKEFESTEAKVRLIDKETKTPINGAVILLNSSDLSYELIEDSNNFYKKTGIPLGEELLMKITAEGYNEYTQRVSFVSNQVKEIQLEPSIQAYVGKAAVGFNVKGIDEKLINDVKVTVYNKQSNTIEVSDYTRNGSIVASITAGIPLRITAQKEGYLTYDSDKFNEGITIREKEKQVNITLEQGGQKLHVSVNDVQSGLSLEGALVQIFYSDLSLFDQKNTAVTGVEFNGLDPEEFFYISAFVEGYLPRTEKVFVSSIEEVKILLNKVSSSNSARLDIYSVDSKAKPINGVNVIINEIIDGNVIPSGLPLLETSFAGYASAIVEAEKTFQIIGFNESFEASSVVELSKNEFDKKVYLNMQKKVNVIEMRFLDVFGKEIEGTVTIDALDGTNLYDEEIYAGTIYFNGDQRETVEVNVTLNDGNVFTENVIIKGKDYVEVIVYNKDPDSLTPLIEFVGIETENGENVFGVTPGAFYWIKFSVNYPRAATKGGIHFRAGSDNTPLADSERIGVYDLSMQGATINYSTSFTQEPAPGNEAIDRANIGSQGEKNKWIEGIITQPRGTYTIKVKIRAEDYTAGKVQLKYRAWAIVGEEYYRNPIDDVLNTKAYSTEKSGLYALTLIKDLVMYESLPKCTDTLCVTTNFVDVEENLLDSEKFEALRGKLYALEVEVSSKEQDNIKLEVSSDNNINFDSTQTGTLYFAREDEFNGSKKKNASITLFVTQEGSQKTRFYFTAEEIGGAKINLIATGKNSVEKELNFKVVDEKNLLVELSEDQVIVGKNFTVKVTDSGLMGLINALIKIVDGEGKTVKTILGDNTDGKGKNGYYRIQNNLSVGLYTIEVSAPTFATNTLPLLVNTRNVFSFPSELEVKLPQGQKYITIDASLVNNSDFVIQSISFDVDGESEEETQIDYETGEIITSGNFRIIPELPLAMSKNQKQTIPIKITFNGEDNDSADETLTLTISGLVEGQFLAKVSSEIHIVYNRKLDPSCLKVDESNATINLIGNEGANDSIAIEVTNNCDQAITLKKTIRAKTKLSAIQLDAEDYLDLQAGEVKEITLRAYNWVERVRDESYSFEIIYDSNYLKKSINLNVRLINPTLALSYPAQITLYLAQGAIKDKATAAQPIYITNISAVPIENITFSQSSAYSASGVKLEIQPVGSINLERGQAITPPRVIFATANSTITEPVESLIEIHGRFSNLNNKAAQYDRYQYYDLYNSGAQSLNSYTPNTATLSSYTNTNKVLGVIKVLSMYSGYNCLKANLADSLGDPYMFPSSGVQIGKMITVTNTCAEPVMISGATPADYKPNTNTYGMVTPLASPVMLFLPQVMVQPGAAVKIPLSITTTSPTVKREKYEIVVNGVTQASQTLISSKPFSIKLYSGIALNEEKSKSTTVKLRECVASNSKEESKEIELTAPLTTESTNCAERYCDAQNAAKYLSQKILQVVQKARSAGYSNKNTTTDGFPCQLEGACTFAEIGMNEEELFDLYLQNDSISTHMLNKELNNLNDAGNDTPFREGAYLSSGFLVEPTLVDLGYIKQRAIAGYGKTVFFDTSFDGCGYYQVSISGAFKSGIDGLETMTPVLIIRARPINGASKIVTKECQNQITNITNFNPINAGLNPGKEYGSWLTTINSETKFNDIAKSISKNRFKTEDRVTNSSNGNIITINQGALTNALAQVCVSGTDKKNIIVTIDSSIATSIDPKQKDSFTQLIIKLVSDTLGGKFGNNCVIKTGEEYSCINLSELGSLGDRKIILDSSELMFSSSNGGCVNATLYSTINEQLTFSAIPLMTPLPFYGVREITVSTDDTLTRPIMQIEKTTLDNTTSTNTKTNTTQNNSSSNTTNNPTNSTQTPNNSKTNQPSPVKTIGENNSVEKIFFAEENPKTQKSPQSLDTRVTSGVVYTMKFNGGGIANQTTINNPMQLIPNPSSQQYKYYRNIKICANPTDKDNAGKDTQVEYTKANGVMFEIAVRNSMSNETAEDAKQRITINTGTLHPDDLAKFICKVSSLAGKEDYKYYFTTGWMDTLNEDVPELGAYLEGLKRQGVVDNCILFTNESGLSGTNAYDIPASEAIGEGLISYMGVCSATSAVCNGFTSGSTVFGAVLGTIFDCGIPVLTTYRTELSKSSGAIKTINEWLNKLGEATKDIPLVGGTLKSIFAIKEDISDAQARPGLLYQTGENVADAFLTRLTVEGWSKMTSPWAISTQHNFASKVLNYSDAVGSKGLTVDALDLAGTPLQIRTFSQQASTKLIEPYEETMKSLLGVTDLSTNADATKLINDLKKSINDDIAKSISASADEVYTKGGKVLNPHLNRINNIPTDSYADAVRKALAPENFDQKFIELASKTDSLTGQTSLQKILGLTSPDPTRAMTMEEVISQLKAKGGVAEDIGNGLSIRLIKPAEVTQAAKKAALSICIQETFMMDDCVKQLEIIFKGDKAKAADVAKIYEGKVKGWTKSQLKAARKNIAGGTDIDDLTKLIDDVIVPTKSADDALKELTNITNSKAKSALKKNTDDLIKSARAGGILNSAKSLGKSMTLGIGCSYLSDYAGQKAFKEVTDSKTKELKQAAKKALNLNTILQKNKTYSISIGTKSGEPYYSIEEIKDFTEMNKTIYEKKGELISTKKLIENKLLSSDEKLPEERKLSYWKIRTSISVAKQILPRVKYPFEESEINHQLGILGDEGIRNLIFEYTNPSSKYKIIGAHESEVIAIMLYFWGGRDVEGIYTQIESEKRNKNGLIKEYVQTLLKIHTIHNPEEGITLKPNEIIKGFGENKINREGAEKLIKMISFWYTVENASPDVAIPSPNSKTITSPSADNLIPQEEPKQAS